MGQGNLVDVNGAVEFTGMRNVDTGKIDANLKGRLEGGDQLAVAAGTTPSR